MEESKYQLFEAKHKMKDTIIQVKYIIDGLKYHFSNIDTLYSNFRLSNNERLLDCENIIKAIKHETVAYLNRLGQFYYFSKSPKVKEIVSNPQSDFKFISKIIDLRMKQTAHRASDMPRESDKVYDIINLDKRFSYGTYTINNVIVFDLYHEDHEKSIEFEPLKDHAQIEAEISDFIEKLNLKIYEEDSTITNGTVSKWLVNELYRVMFFAEGDNRLDVLLKKSKFNEKEVKEVIAHLIAIDWIFKHNGPKHTYLLKRKNLLRKIEKRNIIEPEMQEIVGKNRERVLKAISHMEEHNLEILSCKLLGTAKEEKDSSSLIREDLGVGIDFLAFYKEDLKDFGYLTGEYKLTEFGKQKVLLLK